MGRLSTHFSLEELTFSQTAIRHGILNAPGPEEIRNLEALCQHVLEPAREALGPIHVNSGFRNRLVNTLVGGSPTSQHMKGEAADLRPGKATLQELLLWLYENVPFDQCIWEYGHWIHVSHVRNGTGRRELLAAFRLPGQGTVYRIAGSPGEAIEMVAPYRMRTA